MVECHLPKVKVASSTLVSRSSFLPPVLNEYYFQGIIMTNAASEYRTRFDRFEKELSLVNSHIRQFSNIRLILFVLTVAFAVIIWRSHNYVLLTAEILAGCVLFVLAVVRHNDLYRKKFICEQSRLINQMGIERLDGDWGKFKDCGDEFVDHEHPYSWDLDIFGKHSVFQWVCACHTFIGRTLFADTLRYPVKDISLIKSKQAALRELSVLLDWRQRFELCGMISLTGANPDRFLCWCEDNKSSFKSVFTKRILRILPFVSLAVGITGLFLTQTLLFFAVMYAVQLAIFALFYSKTSSVINQYEKNGPLLLAFSQLIETIEKQQFSSEHLNKLKATLTTGDHHRASDILHAFSKILSSAELRSNPLGQLIANTVWLWDIQCVLKADALKLKYGNVFRSWIDTIGQYEMLSSLSIAGFENPDWVYPEISDSGLAIRAAGLGHPLLHANARIVNDISIDNAGTVAVVTGSNMSGKSTFLRSVGVNAVLAYAGAPVCAQSCLLPVVNIYSSMRISDDLSSRVSTFYAELLRIRKIVDAVKKSETILYLLDELFRGTNSQDRHDGAVAVLQSLSNNKSIGIVSTHDLELCALAKQEPSRFVNYHFEEHYADNNVVFDYKLKPGQSQTRNAMFLIRMIGIDVDGGAEANWQNEE